MIAVIARILARYLAGALMVWGIIDASEAIVINTELSVALAAALAVGAETAYVFARKRGWVT